MTLINVVMQHQHRGGFRTILEPPFQTLQVWADAALVDLGEFQFLQVELDCAGTSKPSFFDG